jgi:hypothetical protein
MARALLYTIAVTALLVSAALPAAAEYYHRGEDGDGSRGGWHGGVGAVVIEDGVVEAGTGETKPLLVSVLVSGCLAGL